MSQYVPVAGDVVRRINMEDGTEGWTAKIDKIVGQTVYLTLLKDYKSSGGIEWSKGHQWGSLMYLPSSKNLEKVRHDIPAKVDIMSITRDVARG